MFGYISMFRNDKKATTTNMGFSAMLAEEYVLIVPFAYQLQSGLDE